MIVYLWSGREATTQPGWIIIHIPSVYSCIFICSCRVGSSIQSCNSLCCEIIPSCRALLGWLFFPWQLPTALHCQTSIIPCAWKGSSGGRVRGGGSLEIAPTKSAYEWMQFISGMFSCISGALYTTTVFFENGKLLLHFGLFTQEEFLLKKASRINVFLQWQHVNSQNRPIQTEGNSVPRTVHLLLSM